MQKYVIGFLFDNERENLVLIKKTKPAWQNGLLNGVGGKVEPNENYYDAMVREFQEETGVLIINWQKFAEMQNLIDTEYPYEIYIYKAFESINTLLKVTTTTEEEVIVIPLTRVWQHDLVSNLEWLIPLALDEILKLAVMSLKDPK